MSKTQGFLLGVLVTILATAECLAFVEPPKEWRVLTDFDARAEEEAPGSLEAEAALRARIEERLGRGVSVTFDALDGTVEAIYGMELFEPAEEGARAPMAAALELVARNTDLLGVEPTLPDELGNGRSYASPDVGLVHVYLARAYQGLPVFQGELRLHVDLDGRVVALTARGLGPISICNDRLLTPAEGAVAAAQTLGDHFTPIAVSESLLRATFAAGPFVEPVTVEPVVFPVTRGRALQAYRVVMHEGGLGNWYEVLVDAATGDLLYRANWTRYVKARVYDPHPDKSASQLVSLPAGWVATNTTIGNHAVAQEDGDGNDTGGFRPTTDGSGNLDFEVDLTKDPRNYRSAAITNLFYWNNVAHDWFYTLGFTEAAGNFQTSNFGRGGLGNDPVKADAQDGSGVNNANFATPPDGQSPRMQMFLFTAPSPDRDGDYDSDVMLHEAAHGLSNRLVGGPSNASCLATIQGGGMGEGWSDWYAASYGNDGVIGEYVTKNTTTGVRQYSMEASPLSFLDFKSGRTEVHDAGEIWAATLWDVRRKLIAKMGYATGKSTTELLVTDGLALMPCSGGFLPARDALLQADQNRNGGANRCDLWTIFAARGFGYGARSTSANSTTGVTVASRLRAVAESPDRRQSRTARRHRQTSSPTAPLRAARSARPPTTTTSR